ncbi:hypothetical protein CDAR_294281 [Caerostris darwini]|uniref:Uncharacterized protein n=1 Tax=Caerostris darwini TaxID=1538125 RepID=A0AAV4QZA5_9ARAC|nr:hypothetical protein CDAR_294281 [Caerostris darwini]
MSLTWGGREPRLSNCMASCCDIGVTTLLLKQLRGTLLECKLCVHIPSTIGLKLMRIDFWLKIGQLRANDNNTAIVTTKNDKRASNLSSETEEDLPDTKKYKLSEDSTIKWKYGGILFSIWVSLNRK